MQVVSEQMYSLTCLFVSVQQSCGMAYLKVKSGGSVQGVIVLQSDVRLQGGNALLIPVQWDGSSHLRHADIPLHLGMPLDGKAQNADMLHIRMWIWSTHGAKEYSGSHMAGAHQGACDQAKQQSDLPSTAYACMW